MNENRSGGEKDVRDRSSKKLPLKILPSYTMKNVDEITNHNAWKDLLKPNDVRQAIQND